MVNLCTQVQASVAHQHAVCPCLDPGFAAPAVTESSVGPGDASSPFVAFKQVPHKTVFSQTLD